MGEKICAAAWQQGAKVVLLPTVPYGTQTNQQGFPLAMNVNPSTLAALVTDLVESLVHHGILKIVLLNSHGGNDFKALLRELYGRTPAKLFLCNWYQVCQDLYGLAADEGRTAATRFEAVNRGWVSITRPWHLLTTNSGAGNPHAATAEKGARFLDLLVPRLATFLVELAAAPLDERFPY